MAAPSANPQAGAVAEGTSVTLSTSTPGAQIYYTLDGSDPANSGNPSRQLYGDGNKPVISAACTLKAVAVLDGVYSAVQTLQYTIEEGGIPLEDGDKVVIYAPAYNKALSSQKTGFYNVGVDIEVSGDTVTGFGDTEVWTVVKNDDGTYSFQQDGQNIGLAESYSSMDLGAVNDDWEVTALPNGTYNIRNTVPVSYTHLPKVGAYVQTEEGRGTVIEVNLLTGLLKVRLDKAKDAAPQIFPKEKVKTIKDAQIRVDRSEIAALKDLEG